jgi:hypothetical protein
MELLITFVIVVCFVVLLWWLCAKLPAPLNLVGQIIVIAGGAIWFLTHIREIIHTIAGSG